MSISRKNSQALIESPQDIVCRLAQDGALAELQNNPDLRHQLTFRVNGISAVMRLAQEGRDDDVEYLIRKFHVSLHDVVEGYARAKNIKKVEEWLLRGASKDAAVYGYARVGAIAAMDDLLMRGADGNCAVHGLAEAGLISEVERLLEDDTYPDTFLLMEYAAKGYALAGMDARVNALMEGGIDLELIIFGYAYAGRIEKVEELLLRGANLDDAIYGYAMAGMVAEVEELAARGGSLGEAMSGYARSGLIDAVIDLLKRDINSRHAAQGFARAGAHSALGALYQYDQLTWIAGGYTDAGDFDHPEAVLRLLTFTANDQLRSDLAREAFDYAESRGEYFDQFNILDMAEYLRGVIVKYDLDYEQALALLEPGVRGWLLQAMSAEPKLSPDMIIKIAALVGEVSHQDMTVVNRAVVKNTHDGAVEKIKQKYRPGLFDCCRAKTAKMRKHDALAELEKHYESPTKRISISK